jgi:hypothetical protein
VKTKIIEAVQSREHPGNWGKFLVSALDGEWARDSKVHPPGARLLNACGWSSRHALVHDLQTGEGAFFKLGGYAHADLEKHAIWVCPLFEPFLEWLYEQARDSGGQLDLDSLPDVVELPAAEFASQGHRRPGPELEATQAVLRNALEALCRRDGQPLDSDAEPGAPARNYELALRLGIGEVFGLVGPG